MLVPASTLGNGSREAWGESRGDGQGCSSVNPFQRMLLLLSLPTQPFNQQNPAERHHGHYCAVLMITCFLLGSGSSSSAEGLKEFPLGWGKHVTELKIHCLGTGEPHSGQGAPSSCQNG